MRFEISMWDYSKILFIISLILVKHHYHTVIHLHHVRIAYGHHILIFEVYKSFWEISRLPLDIDWTLEKSKEGKLKIKIIAISRWIWKECTIYTGIFQMGQVSTSGDITIHVIIQDTPLWHWYNLSRSTKKVIANSVRFYRNVPFTYLLLNFRTYTQFITE